VECKVNQVDRNIIHNYLFGAASIQENVTPSTEVEEVLFVRRVAVNFVRQEENVRGVMSASFEAEAGEVVTLRTALAGV